MCVCLCLCVCVCVCVCVCDWMARRIFVVRRLQIYSHCHFSFHTFNIHNQTICVRHCYKLYQQYAPLYYRHASPSTCSPHCPLRGPQTQSVQASQPLLPSSITAVRLMYMPKGAQNVLFTGRQSSNMVVTVAKSMPHPFA